MSKLPRSRLLIVGGFPRAGHTVYGGIVTASQTLLRSELSDRFDIDPFDSTQLGNPPPGLLVRTGLAALRFARFALRIVTRRPDAVILFAATGFSLIEKGAMARMCRLLGIPVAIFPRGGASIELAARSRFHTVWTRWALAGADKVLCQGPAWHRFVVGLGDHEPRDAPVIENWTATDEICAIGATRTLAKRSKVRLLFVGWLEEDKGVGDLLAACVRLQASHDFLLRIAGDGSYRAEAQRRVDAGGLGDRVAFLGWLQTPQLLEAYRQSDIFVLPSWAEGLPNAMIEAMAAGLPTVVTTVGNIPDLVTDGVDGLLVPPRDVVALAAALESLLADPQRRQALGAQAYVLAKTKFSIGSAVDKLDLAVTEMISCSAGVPRRPRSSLLLSANSTRVGHQHAGSFQECKMTGVSGTSLDLPAGAGFHEGLAATWSHGYRRGSFRRRLTLMRSILDGASLAGSEWLDMGCGSGVLTRALLEGGANATGVDGSPAMIEAAKAGTPDEGRVRWLVSDVERIAPLDDRSFDGIVCSSVIEYVAGPEGLVREAARLLRPDGLLIISVPNSRSPVRLVQKGLRRMARPLGLKLFNYLEYSVYDSTERDFVELLSDCGFRVEATAVFDPFVSKKFGSFSPSALLIFSARKPTSD